MRADPRSLAATLALGAAVASIGYTAFALTRLRAFERRVRHRPPAERHPRVTVLKPLHGDEPGLEENLRSFCAQDYPAFDVIFTVHDADDTALPTARVVAAAFPDRARVVVGNGVGTVGDEGIGAARYANPKIANLAPALAFATGEILAIADSDMRVGPDWLDAVAGAFDDANAGAATCIYRGEPASDSVADALGAMWITDQFAPSTLVANALEPLEYCFGATMAVRRDVFDAIGGFDALGPHVADDHLLGRLVAERGLRVALVPHVVANVVHEHGLRALVQHELRWARTIRSVRPASYPGILLTYPVPLAALALLFARGRGVASLALAAAATVRIALHACARQSLGTSSTNGASNHGASNHGASNHGASNHGTSNDGASKNPVRFALIPLRDALGAGIWLAAFGSGAIRWRGARLTIRPDGTLPLSR